MEKMLAEITDENFIICVFEQMKGSQKVLGLSVYRLPLFKSSFYFLCLMTRSILAQMISFSIL